MRRSESSWQKLQQEDEDEERERERERAEAEARRNSAEEGRTKAIHTLYPLLPAVVVVYFSWFQTVMLPAISTGIYHNYGLAMLRYLTIHI